MAATPKYRAKAVYWDSTKGVVIGTDEIEKYRDKGKLKYPDDIFRFDSQHEFKVYLELCRMYGAERIGRQYKVEIYTSGLCYPKGKNWKIDFSVTSDECLSTPDYLVEAKGAFLPEFAHTLASFEEAQPTENFQKLIVVFLEIPTGNRIIKALLNSDYGRNLLTFEELKCLNHLPLPL